MKAVDFNLSQDLRFNPEAGITSFGSSRLVIFDANAIGLLRQNLIDRLGWEQARTFFLELGYQNGFSDFMQMKVNYEFDSEMDLLASGPVIHTWEGIVRATPKEIKINRERGEFYFTGVWTNSYEAEQHLCNNNRAQEPVCWSLVGYATGWSTAFFGKPLVAIEPFCAGKGDDHCEWLIQPPEKLGDRAKPYLPAYKKYFEML